MSRLRPKRDQEFLHFMGGSIYMCTYIYKYKCGYIYTFIYMYIYIYLYPHTVLYICYRSNGKRKPRRFSLICLPFVHNTNGSYPFANGLNGHAHLCMLPYHTVRFSCCCLFKKTVSPDSFAQHGACTPYRQKPLCCSSITPPPAQPRAPDIVLYLCDRMEWRAIDCWAR